jgi:pyrimidine deaminase RibD-like protein
MRRYASSATLVVLALAALGLPAVPAAAASGGATPAKGAAPPATRPWRLPAPPKPDRSLAVLGGTPGAQAVRGSAAAAALARATGKRVQVSALTTETATVTVAPDGVQTLRDYVLPVRVRRSRGWVPVDTTLRQTTAGPLSPAAIPGDTVTMSGGGAGPMATIAAAGASLKLWWPGRLPSPAVTGSSATYRNVLPGVDLVLTATSASAGGFSEVLVVRTAAAAHDSGLARLALKVTDSGARLRAAAGGGLTAALSGGSGAFVASQPAMWDSSAALPGATASVRAAAASASKVGAGLAAMGSGPRSSAAGPAGGARLAMITASVSPDGKTLRVTPDEKLLTSVSTRFPVFIDPSFTFVTKTGGESAYDPVQSGSGCRSSHYKSSSYPDSPVGYDNFQGGSCQFGDTDYALYVVGIPAEIFPSNANLISASFQTQEVYTSSCSASPSVTASWIGGINSSTGWPGPGTTARNVDATDTVGPDPGSCNTIQNTGKRVAAGFNVKPDLDAISSASAITLRLWEKNNTNDVDHKQFANNPDLQVVYNDTPNVPTGLEEAATNGGTGSVNCATNPAAAPHIGKTDSTNGTFLLASYGDPDGDTVKSNIEYWDNASPTKTFSLSAGSSLSGRAAVAIPASFTAGMANGTIVGWKADAQDGSGSSGGKTYGPYTSAWSSPCYFAVYPSDPDSPTVTAGFDQASNQNVDTKLTFTITQSAGDTASEFVWGLDALPPTTGTIPAGQICNGSSSTCPINSGSATLTITVPSPGPHDLWVYEQDAGGNDSGMTNDAPSGSTSTFTGAADPAVSYTAGTSLGANFAAALGAGQSFDNAMISNSSGVSCGAGTGDGSGTNLDAADLTAAGWKSGQGVTIDGASFSLPGFGGCAAPDNVLAANQTIGAGGAQASALVFLATSTSGFAQVPGLATGSPDSGALINDTTAPAVQGGIGVTGSGCTGVVAFNTNQAGCVPASGTINYAAGCPQGAQTSYDLTVPDWWTGLSDLAAVTMPDVARASGPSAHKVAVYAFAVPLDGACQVSSVTLPDVANTVDASVTSGSGGVSALLPGLHILGVALRNATTATPEASGAAVPAPSGQGWTGAYESPVEGAFGPPAGVTWGNQTIRMAMSPNISAPAGAQLRIRLSNPGFLAADGTGPLVIGAATVAQEFFGQAPAQTPLPLTFGGGSSVTVPEGGDIYSDPLTLPFSVTAGQNLMVSVWVKNTALPDLPENSAASGGVGWFSPSSTPNETQDTTGSPFNGAGSSWIGATPILTGLDVTTPAATVNGIASPGEPTVVVAGDNVIDGLTAKPVSDSLSAPSQRLPGQLATRGLAAGFGVVDAGVQANRVLTDGTAAGGVSLLARIDRDVLAEPDVGTVVLDQGLEDLLLGAGATPSAGSVENGLSALENQLNAFGVNVIVATLTPCAGYANKIAADSCTTGTGGTVDTARMSVNSVIASTGAPDCAADFDAAVTSGASPEALASADDTGDHVNLSFAGYAALAPAVSAGGFCPLLPNNTPLPAVP